MQVVWKRVGQTPLQALEELRAQEGIGADVPMTYAGRLDPLAEGKLIILIGEECKQKEKYLGLDKEYEFEVLLGVSTDTGDVMGLINKPYQLGSPTSKLISAWRAESFEGEYICKYPTFSSKTVQNKDGITKPLFLWALEGRLSEIKIPKKEVQIFKLQLLSTSALRQENVLEQVLAKIAKIARVKEKSKWLGEDFRRSKVTQSWRERFRSLPEHSSETMLILAKFRCICSGGTYMRTLARDIAQELGTEGLAWSIKRTKIGRYKKPFNKISFWYKSC